MRKQSKDLAHEESDDEERNLEAKKNTIQAQRAQAQQNARNPNQKDARQDSRAQLINKDQNQTPQQQQRNQQQVIDHKPMQTKQGSDTQHRQPPELTKDQLPSKHQYKQVIEFLQESMMLETVLNGVRSILKGTSILEILTFCLSLLFFLGSKATGLHVGILVLNILHLGRGCAGLLLSGLVPQTQTLIADFSEMMKQR